MKPKVLNQHLSCAPAARLLLWLAALALLVFVGIARELTQGNVAALDRGILLSVASTRTPWLTTVAVDVTTLGSVTLVVLFTAFTLVVLLVLRNWRGAIQVILASAGAGILSVVTKSIFERTRPEEVLPLIAVSGFSYPSGHSLATSALYLTIAIIAVRPIQQAGVRAAVFGAVSIVILMVGASRMYLGVHYATDVMSGISLGAAWALLLGGLFTLTSDRASNG